VFLGHGLLALRVNPSWLVFFETVGLSVETGMTLMPLVGLLDVALALTVLVYPMRVVLMWMTVWALWTAALRPLSGQGILEFVERGGNFGAPLALLFVRGLPRSWKALVE
jgi:hypothetical protein